MQNEFLRCKLYFEGLHRLLLISPITFFDFTDCIKDYTD
jgi:hypothetical protein